MEGWLPTDFYWNCTSETGVYNGILSIALVDNPIQSSKVLATLALLSFQVALEVLADLLTCSGLPAVPVLDSFVKSLCQLLELLSSGPLLKLSRCSSE